jgi:uracil-DNA glycosylase
MAAQNLNQLQASMKNCRLCLNAGYFIVPPAVFSGDEGAKIMIIGQAPGITEVEAERPFNAGSGKRLFQWLAQAGIEEEDFRKTQYMTAVTKCYPGRSGSGSGDRVPSKVERELCRPYLDSEMELVDPALIIPVGRLAINLFFSSNRSLREIIGNEIEWKGRKVIPLPHSSGASRWHQSEENRTLIGLAINRIRDYTTR